LALILPLTLLLAACGGGDGFVNLVGAAIEYDNARKVVAGARPTTGVAGARIYRTADVKQKSRAFEIDCTRPCYSPIRVLPDESPDVANHRKIIRELDRVRAHTPGYRGLAADFGTQRSDSQYRYTVWGAWGTHHIFAAAVTSRRGSARNQYIGSYVVAGTESPDRPPAWATTTPTATYRGQTAATYIYGDGNDGHSPGRFGWQSLIGDADITVDFDRATADFRFHNFTANRGETLFAPLTGDIRFADVDFSKNVNFVSTTQGANELIAKFYGPEHDEMAGSYRYVLEGEYVLLEEPFPRPSIIDSAVVGAFGATRRP